MACRTRRDRSELLRFVRGPDGRVTLDPGGRLEGRGAYLCADDACWRTALKRSSLQRALHAPLALGLERRLEHGDVAAIRDATDLGAPVTMGGTDGT